MASKLLSHLRPTATTKVEPFPDVISKEAQDFADKLYTHGNVPSEEQMAAVPQNLRAEVTRAITAMVKQQFKTAGELNKLKGNLTNAQEVQDRELQRGYLASAVEVTGIDAGSNQANLTKLKLALELDPRNRSRRRRGARIRSMSQMVFFLVLVGCEMDFIGFSMAFGEYWAYKGIGSSTVKAMLILMPFSFCIAVTLNMCYTVPSPSQSQGSIPSKPNPMLTTPAPGRSGQSAMTGLMKSNALELVVRTKTEIKFYHLLPLFRTFCVVKSTDENDIEAIFRVNSLSSFTLGMAQMVAIMFTVFVGGQIGSLSLMVKVNMGTFVFNWLITVIYFASPIATNLKTAIGVFSLTSNLGDILREEKTRILAAVRHDAVAKADQVDNPSAPTGEVFTQVAYLKNILANEIYSFTEIRVKLDNFTPREIMEIRQELYRRVVADYAMD